MFLDRSFGASVARLFFSSSEALNGFFFPQIVDRRPAFPRLHMPDFFLFIGMWWPARPFFSFNAP